VCKFLSLSLGDANDGHQWEVKINHDSVCFVCVFVHSRFIENPLIDLEVANPLFLRWFCHTVTETKPIGRRALQVEKKRD
jgi:hypothetical protein